MYFIDEKHFEGGNLRVIIEESLLSTEREFIEKMISLMTSDEKVKEDLIKHYEGKRLVTTKEHVDRGLITFMTKIENLFAGPIIYFSDKDIESEILFSINNSPNILNQAGVFIWNSDPSKPIELIGQEQNEKIPNDNNINPYFFCNCFNIHKKLKNYIRNKLESDGITKEHIYPSSEIDTWNVFEKSKSASSKK